MPGPNPPVPPIPPIDPNELLGPSGYGPQNYIQTTELLPYRINFENDKSALAPAHQVTVSNPLSANFDWTTFQLTEVGFGDHFIAVPAGLQHFTTVEKMTYNGLSFEVHIEAGIHLDTGEVYAKFTSLDPLTGLPPTVDIGFLPPENGTGRGQGHVSYSVKQKAGLSNNVESRNIASIVFDGLPAITTNQVDPHDVSKGTDPTKEAPITNWTGPLPIVATGAATGISTSSATLNGTVSPNNYPTTAKFEYGLTTAYGNTANATPFTANGTSLVDVNATIGNLQAGATYHYRLIASNSLGDWIGNDAQFQILKADPIVGSSPNPSTYAQSVNFTVMVSGNGPTPTGTVTFKADGVTMAGCGVNGTVNLSNGSATCADSSLPVAGSPHAISADYSGDGNYDPSSGSLSAGQTVNKADQTIVCGQPPVIIVGDSGTLDCKLTVRSILPPVH